MPLALVALASLFLSTPSARRATPRRPARSPSSCNFYPRPLRGGRPITVPSEVLGGEFLSTPSARRATLRRDAHLQRHREFLSTPSARRATPSRHSRTMAAPYFYPRPLRGGRHGYPGAVGPVQGDFYPRPLRGGRRKQARVAGGYFEFLSTPSARRATTVDV